MFTGIIEEVVEVKNLEKNKGNLKIYCQSSISHELKINQSVAHNGVCLSISDIKNNIYSVTAVKETLDKTNLNYLKIGSKINIERCMKFSDRFDGHIVQGHVDLTAKCIQIIKEKGSHVFKFQHNKCEHITVEKGSICVNGISLTVFDVDQTSFHVAIIPYTFQNTNLHKLQIGDYVNIEFDILGKYIAQKLKVDHK